MKTKIGVADVRAAIARWTRADRKDKVLALRALQWTGDQAFTIDGEAFVVVECPSPLAVRAAIVEHGTTGAQLVVVTEHHDLGADMVARLVGRRVVEVDAWSSAKALFAAHALDPKLQGSRWIADTLVAVAPAVGYPAVASGVLDETTARRALLLHGFGIDPDAGISGLLRWSVDPLTRERAARMPEEAHGVVGAWADSVLGRPAAQIVASVLIGEPDAARAIAVGLVAPCLVPAETESQRAACVRLEPFVGGVSLQPDDARAWSHAATAIIDSSSAAIAADLRHRGERLLDELRATDEAWRSDVLDIGFGQRLNRFARALEGCLAELPTAPSLEGLTAAAARVVTHQRARIDTAAARGSEMAVRLVRWLARPVADPSTLAGAARLHVDDLSYVDWARRLTHELAGSPELSAALAELCVRVDTIRLERDRSFARFLAEDGTRSNVNGVLLVEQVLGDVVAPLAENQSVVLVVADALSASIAHELTADLQTRGWVGFAPTSGDLPPVLAALPTVTEVSRASLLAGRRAVGQQAVEIDGLATHEALLRASGTTGAPRLWHKATVSGGTGIAPELRADLASERRVVAVVVNAIDDHLSGSDQIRHPFDLDTLRPLAELFEAARDAGRIVIVTADHGHVLEWGDSEFRTTDGVRGERWRTGEVQSDEVALCGERVLLGDGMVVAPATERLRYLPTRKRGYHGGATAQEAVVPLLVFSPLGTEVAGWREIALTPPIWWDENGTVAAPTRQPATTRPRPKRSATPELFPDAEAPVAGGWIDALVRSDVLASQRRRATRTPVADDRLQALLAALDQRGGVMTVAALARTLDIPELRIAPLVSAVRRLLNVDGYPVLDHDPVRGEVRLDVALARSQFGLGDA